MANYASLKAAIQQVVKTNGNNEITGSLLQQSLLAMINSLGGYYQFAGVATQSTNPGTPDQNVFYLASTAGTYTNFGGLVLADGEIAILKYNGAWSKDSIGAASLEKFNELQQEIYDFAAIKSEESLSPSQSISGLYIRAANGDTANYSGYYGRVYNVSGKRKVKVHTTTGNTELGTQRLAFYSSASTFDSTTALFVDGRAPVNSDYTTEFDVPTGAVSLLVIVYGSLLSQDVKEVIITPVSDVVPGISENVSTLLETVDDLETNVEEINNEIFSERPVPVSAESEDGYSILSNGNIQSGDSYGSIYRKNVNPGERYVISLQTYAGGTNRYSYAVYNSITPSASSLVLIGPEIREQFSDTITIPSNGVLLVWGKVTTHTVTVQKIESYSKIEAIEDSMSIKRLYLKYNSTGIKINQKYSANYDIQYWLNRFGVNNLMQLYAHGFISNTENIVSIVDPVNYTLSGSDWVGPIIMSALQNPTGGSNSFTGGCHGSNGDATGDPTAATIDVQVYADNRNVTIGSALYCDDVRVVVKNRIRAGNTQGASGRYVLEEIVTYHFKDNKIYVSVCSEALENIRVSTYYGMQMNNYLESAMFFGKTAKAGTFSPSTSFPEKCFLGVGFDANGRICAMHLETVGLGCNDHTDTTKYCFTSGNKMYYSLVNPNSTLTVDSGDKFYWAGWYQFSDVLKIDELTY